MKTFFLSMLFVLTSSVSFAESCAEEKRTEYEKLVEMLKRIEPQEALGATQAYRVVGMYEAVANDENRCVQMNRLLQDIRDTIEIYE